MNALVAVVGFYLGAVGAAAVNSLEKSSSNELSFLAEKQVTTIILRFDEKECEFVHPSAIKAFQTAARDCEMQPVIPESRIVFGSLSATLRIVTPEGSRQWAMVMVEQVPGSGSFIPAKIGSTWIPKDSLFARLIGTMATMRLSQSPEHSLVSDRDIPGGFTPEELKRIDSETVRKIAAENRDWKPGIVSTAGGSCCGATPTLEKTVAACGQGGSCTCGDSCGTDEESNKSSKSPK